MMQVRADLKADKTAVKLLVPITIAETADGVSLYDQFGEKFLGEDGWVQERHVFNNFDIREAGDDCEIIIPGKFSAGIAEFSAISVQVGERSFDVTWPGGVVADHEGSKRSGGLRTSLLADQDGQHAEQVSATLTVEDVVPSKHLVPEKRNKSPKSRRGLWFLLAGLVLGIGVSVGGFVYFEDIERAVRSGWALALGGGKPVDECSKAGILAGAPKFDIALDRLNRCGSSADSETAFAVIEHGEQSGSAQASYLIGRLYQGEEVYGINFGKDPSLSVVQFRMAVNRDPTHGDAGTRLDAVCELLDGSNIDTERLAYNENCKARR